MLKWFKDLINNIPAVRARRAHLRAHNDGKPVYARGQEAAPLRETSRKHLPLFQCHLQVYRSFRRTRVSHVTLYVYWTQWRTSEPWFVNSAVFAVWTCSRARLSPRPSQSGPFWRRTRTREGSPWTVRSRVRTPTLPHLLCKNISNIPLPPPPIWSISLYLVSTSKEIEVPEPIRLDVYRLSLFHWLICLIALYW